MAATVRSASTYASAATEASTSGLTLPSGWQPGDVIYIGCELTAATGSITTPSGWTAVVAQFVSAVGSTPTSGHTAVFRRVMQPGDTDPVISFTSGRFAAAMVAVQGADNGTPEDVTPTTDDNTGVTAPSVRAPSITPVTAGCLLITFHAVRNLTSGVLTAFTPDASETEQADAGTGVAAVSEAAVEAASLALTDTSATGTKTATATGSNVTSLNMMGAAIAVRPAGAQAAGGVPLAPWWHPGLGLPGLPGATPFWAPPQPWAPSPAVAVTSGPPVYPLGHPVQARALPQRGGSTASRAGVFAQAGPPVKAQQGPVKAQPATPVLTGRASRRVGAFGGTGPAVRPPQQPVAAKGRGLPPRGPATGRAGAGPYTAVSGIQAAGQSTFALTLAHNVGQGDALVVSASSNSSVTAPVSVADSAGNQYYLATQDTARSPNVSQFVAMGCKPLAAGTDTITVTFAGTATQKCVIVRGCPGMASFLAVDAVAQNDAASSASPSVTTGTLSGGGEWAVAALADGTAGGTPSSWANGFMPVPTVGAGPFFTVADRSTTGTSALTAGASITAATFTMAMVVLSPVQVAAAPVIPPRGPVQAKRLPQPGGHMQSRAGTFTVGGPQAGPPVYPLTRPVRSRPQPPPRGRIVRAAGTYAGTGPPAIVVRQPDSAARRPLPPRGRAQALRGPYGQTGPPVIPLRRPVRGQPQRPLLTGRAAWRAGTFTAPFVPPFTVGALTAADKPRSVLTAAGAASALAASTAAQGTITATDQRSGGPG